MEACCSSAFSCSRSSLRRAVETLLKPTSSSPRWMSSLNASSSSSSFKLNELAFFRRTIPFLRCKASSSRNGMTVREFCGHFGFIFLGSSYLVEDPFALRALAAASFSSQICFQFFRETPQWLPIRWNAFFVFVNVAWLAKMMNDRDLSGLSQDEDDIRFVFQNRGSGNTSEGFQKLTQCG